MLGKASRSDPHALQGGDIPVGRAPDPLHLMAPRGELGGERVIGSRCPRPVVLDTSTFMSSPRENGGPAVGRGPGAEHRAIGVVRTTPRRA